MLLLLSCRVVVHTRRNINLMTTSRDEDGFQDPVEARRETVIFIIYKKKEDGDSRSRCSLWLLGFSDLVDGVLGDSIMVDFLGNERILSDTYNDM